jgi:hypothetical protein
MMNRWATFGRSLDADWAETLLREAEQPQLSFVRFRVISWIVLSGSALYELYFTSFVPPSD